MINVKDQIYSALLNVCDNVSDSYPTDWVNYPAIQYVEEDNKVYEYTEQEDMSYVRYKVDIWHDRSTSDIALKVDEAISALGLRRILCQDVEDTIKHKLMRYEGIVDNKTQIVYQD